jgi:argininosuccinate synthase
VKKEKIVLAYSGGLDTSIAIKWLQEEYDVDVIALGVDVGQGGDLEEAKERALKIGALESYLIDAKAEFVSDYLFPALKANALYEGKYPLVSALSRPLIAKWQVEIAASDNAQGVAHGCTGKGNDQVRFEVSIGALNPDLKIIAPMREWSMSREKAMDYASKHGIPVPTSKKKPYSIDENLWGRAIECGVLENPWNEPPRDIYELTCDVSETPNEMRYVEIDFVEGIPVAIDGKKTNAVDLIAKIGEIAGQNGFGRLDMIENRLVGIKSREVYEAPAALSLILAHQSLEELTLEREVLHYKSMLEQKYAELIYYGLWFSPLKDALDGFIEKTQERVSGTIRLRFHKGTCAVVGRKSEESLYDYSLATYEEADQFSHDSAKGFIDLWGLPSRVWAKKCRESGVRSQESKKEKGVRDS